MNNLNANRVKLSDGVEYEKLYNSMENTILEWEKQNLGNPYFCKFNSPVVKELNNQLFQDYIVLQEDGNVSIASPLVFLESDIKKWKNIKSVVNTVALTENGEVFSANLPFEQSKANMQDSDFTDWKDVNEIYSASTPGIWGKHDIVALQKDGRIRWRENNIFKGNLVVQETSAWENIKNLYICDADKLVLAAVDFDGNILVSGDDELKKKVAFLTASPKKIFFTVKQDIIALYDDGHIECTFDDELSKMLNSFNKVENIFADNNEFNPNILVVQKDNANSIFYVYRDLEVEIAIEKIDLVFDEICMLNEIWKSPICIKYKNQKTYYTWETTFDGRTLKPFEDMNRFKWEDLAGVAYEKSGTGKLFLKRNGTLISNYDDEYINSIENVKEAGMIASTLLVLKDNNDFEIHDYWAKAKHTTIENCEKFLILNLLNHKENASVTQHIFVLHDGKLTVYTRPTSFGSIEPEICGEYDDVQNIFMAPNGETVCVRFNNGRLKTFGEYIFDSNIDFDGASIYYYGPKLEDGAMKLQSKYDRDDSLSDERSEFTGIFGLQKNGKCFVLTNKNWIKDSIWCLSTNSSFQMEKNCDVKEIIPSRFLYLNKFNVLKSFKFSIMQQAITSFSASIYYEVFVNYDGVIDGKQDTKYGCCKFAGIGPVKKALAFPMGTVVLTQDGKLKSLCNKATERAYENLPVKSGVKDILANYSLFAILCENGDLYVCKRQKAVYYHAGFEKLPFASWKLALNGVDHLESNGEELIAVLKNQDKRNSIDFEIEDQKSDSKVVSDNAPALKSEKVENREKKEQNDSTPTIEQNTTSKDKSISELSELNNSGKDEQQEIASRYFVVENGVLTKYTGYDTEIIIPNTVTTIGKKVFKGNHMMRKVVIPESVIEIDEHAFEFCLNLEEVILPSKLQTIKKLAFYCAGFKSIEIPQSVQFIGNQAFHSLKLKNVTLLCEDAEIDTTAFDWNIKFSGPKKLYDRLLEENVSFEYGKKRWKNIDIR